MENNGIGQGSSNNKPEPFKVDRTPLGMVYAYAEITERVMNGQVDPRQAQEGTRALNGATGFVKTQIEAMKLIDKGSTRLVRNAAAELLGIEVITDQSKSAEKETE